MPSSSSPTVPAQPKPVTKPPATINANESLLVFMRPPCLESLVELQHRLQNDGRAIPGPAERAWGDDVKRRHTRCRPPVYRRLVIGSDLYNRLQHQLGLLGRDHVAALVGDHERRLGAARQLLLRRL